MEKLDVIITSSCRKHIESTLESFLSRVHCSIPYRFIVHIDVRDETYVPRELSFLKSKGITDIHLNRDLSGAFTANLGKALLFLFNRIESPLYFHLEDDWKFLRPIDLDPLLALMNKYAKIDHIRFNKDRIKQKAWLYYLSEDIAPENFRDNLQCTIDGVNLVLSSGWSFNPSINRSSIVTSCVDTAAMLADPEFHLCRTYEAAHDNRGTYIYGKIGDQPLVRDTGRNRMLQWLRKMKYILAGGKYAEYKF